MAKALSRKVTIYINGREVENTLSSLRAEMKKLELQQGCELLKKRTLTLMINNTMCVKAINSMSLTMSIE